MADKQHEYTVTTPHGDVNLTTPNHHSAYASLEEFLKAHKSTIESACSVGGVAITAMGLHLSHGRGGKQLKIPKVI
jgi:hypothetical protein